MAAQRLLAALLLFLCNVHRQVLARTLKSQARSTTSRTLDTIRLSKSSPVQQVVNLLHEMYNSLEDEAKADLDKYDKKMCWCKTNEEEKRTAIASGSETIASLQSFLEEAAGKIGKLSTEVEILKSDIAESEAAMKSALAQRDSDKKAFLESEEDMKENIGLLTQAVSILSKVQLVQTSRLRNKDREDAALVQVHQLIKRSRYAKFSDRMQKDLFSLFGAIKDDTRPDAVSSLTQVEQPASRAATEKSYNKNTGEIFGMLSAMKDRVTENLKESQETEAKQAAQFEKLRKVKEEEISSAQEQVDLKEARLAELKDKRAVSQSDKSDLEDQVANDQSFLADLLEECKKADKEYQARSKMRTEESKAIAEAQAILSGDDARSLFDKTVSFVQVQAAETKISRAHSAKRGRHIAEEARSHLIKAAAESGSNKLALLAERIRLDAFSKVREAMDKMLAELQEQQKEEYDQKDECTSELDKTEDQIKEAQLEEEDLETSGTQIDNALKLVNDEITNFKTQVADMEVALKQAGEARKAENHFFRDSVSDQRATVHVLTKAVDRLKSFYAPKAGVDLIQSKTKEEPVELTRGGRVIVLLESIVKDAEDEVEDLEQSEASAQKAYGEFVTESNAEIESLNGMILAKEAQAAKEVAKKSDNHEALGANAAKQERLMSLLSSRHAECDFILKYFDIRQKARAQEISAISEAKAILSGAKYDDVSS